MNNFSVEPHILEGEYGSILLSSDSSVSVTISFVHSLPELSIATLLVAD